MLNVGRGDPNKHHWHKNCTGGAQLKSTNWILVSVPGKTKCQGMKRSALDLLDLLVKGEGGLCWLSGGR